MKTSQCRIKRIRFKSGGEIVPLKTPEKADFQWVFEKALEDLKKDKPIAVGYFIVGEHKSYTEFGGNQWPTIVGGAEFLSQEIADAWRDV